MKLHLTWSLSPEFARFFEQALPPNCRLTHGSECPDDVEILVQGRPSSEELEPLQALKALVIPFAGIPARTRDLLLERPDLAAYNLHHNAPSSAEMAIGLMIAAAKRISAMDQAMRQGRWALAEMPQHCSLHGKSVMILGFGEIGRRVGRICQAMDMQVSALARRPFEVEGVRSLSAETWRDQLPDTDFLQICLPLTPETEALIGERELKLLPDHAVVVNTARGPIIEEEPFYRALKEKRLGGAGLDVWWQYPESRRKAFQEYPSQFPFEEMPQVVMTPHRAGDFGDSQLEQDRLEAIACLMRDLSEGREPPNRIDPQLGY